MMLPIIARAADVVLRVVPGGLREASLALGASRWRTVWHVVLPTARPGLATALILGIARGIGETSPVLLTSGAATSWSPTRPTGAMNSLPLFIYSNVRSGDPIAIQRAYGAAFVLLALVLVLFVVARLLARAPASRRPADPEGLMNTRRTLAVALAAARVAAVAALAGWPPATADGTRRHAGAVGPRAAYATIEGTGSTWSELIVKQWIADVDANGIKVVYTGGGSSKGRKDFAQNTTDFAISEIPYQGNDETGQADTSNGRDYAYLPLVAGGTAFTYQLKVGDTQVKNLRLSGETLAKIFTNEITNWNDPAITADNNGRTFPDKPIMPVVRSDGSGTTAQFTDLARQGLPVDLAALLRPVRA